MKRQAILCFLLQLSFELFSCTHLRVIPGSTLELPCLPSHSDFAGADITWKFNGKDMLPSRQSSGSVTVKKNGLSLSISPVTAANEGDYECLVKDSNMELLRTYKIAVDAAIGYTIKVTEGGYVNLPCHFSPSSQFKANALWFKEPGVGTRTELNVTNDNGKLELLYPDSSDQTVLLRDTAMEDAGIYLCESAEGEKLSSVYLIVDAGPTPEPHSCTNFTSAWEPCLDVNIRIGEALLQESMTEFSMKLYSYLRELYPSTNLLFSPISISGVLSHLLLGARDDTRRAIESALRVPNDYHCVHLQTKKLRDKLSSSLQMASQIYYNPQMNLSESFTSQSIQFYEAEPVKLLETNEENTEMINSWVANKTKNKITHLVDSISPNAQLILLNAVSFSGQWNAKFDPKQRKGHFVKLDGEMVKVPLLYHQKYMVTVMYDVELKAQVAKFGLTGESSLYILLPRFNKVTDLQQVEEKMTDTAVLQMIQQMKTTAPQLMEVTLPQIKLEVQPDMNLLIKKLGLSSLFERPNLCGLYSEQPLVLDDARHKAFLALTEQGVEAGAVTAMSFSRSYPIFSAMRPFILLLWNDQANVPLFIGRVTDP
ncbi:plasma protease C1 inhibitor [Acanthochromis polyacanthus]|uniref:Serpin peptidase inhibitor, clade G (C1 inhibitor), member 1 n=1 Tax=Acanthochromis polyacanthus TaxID=80966 RepID=A0A3Q1GC40_9TELE|nr:plasma protease C1 inhibitor [Acanthochromis polyacanthus]